MVNDIDQGDGIDSNVINVIMGLERTQFDLHITAAMNGDPLHAQRVYDKLELLDPGEWSPPGQAHL
jgi:hypothetical protein|eukprot:CAMPEP_0181179332 /NCGR_PEP_ID=MMETSP1096-20121128/6206_1 /TAXON_ID=156174 ORGANISM="Chrysochromulina ericina, Strain CCMP281" /NCGR_SAMPLE_ID=MMETSP1096 /ASSEMBLY_ACC=CAM_ASM_000453 /LENGTH=65 /DNA_ID=CAMNT_0023267679 /DNA_START=293 /DNA_END=490 /DNA_ORIENTATION=-